MKWLCRGTTPLTHKPVNYVKITINHLLQAQTTACLWNSLWSNCWIIPAWFQTLDEQSQSELIWCNNIDQWGLDHHCLWGNRNIIGYFTLKLSCWSSINLKQLPHKHDAISNFVSTALSIFISKLALQNHVYTGWYDEKLLKHPFNASCW